MLREYYLFRSTSNHLPLTVTAC